MFDVQATLNVVVQGVVFLPMWTGLVIMFGRFFLGSRSKMYDAAIKETLEYNQEIAKYAATAVIAAQIFKTAKKDNDERGLSEADLATVFDASPGVPTNLAAKLAKEIIAVADSSSKDGDGNGFITLPELTDVLTNNVCSWKRMLVEVSKDDAKGAKLRQVAPEPVEVAPASSRVDVPAAPPQTPAAQGNVIQVVCPPGVVPGQMMQVATPNGNIQCAVPANIQPGQQFSIQVPPPAQAPAASMLTVTCPLGAAAGHNIQVQGPGGLINVTVPPGVQSGGQFQVRVG